MKRTRETLLALDAENRKSIEYLELIFDKIGNLKKRLEDTPADEFLWLAMSQLLSNYYTLSETILFRCAQRFENDLDPTRWQKSLLKKMRIEIEGIRPAFLDDSSYEKLDELRRFRHFLRYYHELQLDFDKVNRLLMKTIKLNDQYLSSFYRFSEFVTTLAEQSDA